MEKGGTGWSISQAACRFVLFLIKKLPEIALKLDLSREIIETVEEIFCIIKHLGFAIKARKSLPFKKLSRFFVNSGQFPSFEVPLFPNPA
ncbi:MAG: hypothetical protein H7Y12_09550 [Sphingobacteriaceae bacterium]|nr:hypothetical protein [Cytophagaceae bacterium]